MTRLGRAPVLAILATALAPATASAQDSGGRVSVLSFDGPNAEMVRRAVVRALGDRDELELVPRADVQATVERVGAGPGAPDGWAEVAREHEVDAFVEGRVFRRGRGWRAAVRVRTGETGEVIATLERAHRSGRALMGRIRRGAWSELGEALLAARRPAPEQAETSPPDTSSGAPDTDFRRVDEAAADADAADGAAGEASADDGPRALRVALGLELFSRELRFTDDVLDELPDYELSVAPAVLLSLAWYPGAHFTDGIGASFGLTARLARGFAIESVSDQGDGPRRDTERRITELGLRWQHAFGPVAPLLALAYGIHKYRIETSPAGPSVTRDTGQVPFAKYLYLRIAGGAAVDVGPLFVDLELAWLHLAEVGQLDDAGWFPRTDGAGGEMILGVGYLHDSGLEVRVSGRFRRYFFDLHAEPGDPRVAGGAVDQSFAGALELGWRL